MATTAVTGGNAKPLEVQPQSPPPPNGAGGTPLSAAPTSSPVGIMDWQSKLQQGNTNAQTRDVQSNELVSKQLTDLTSSDNKYIQQARDKANSASSQRGMLMSSMAGGNAERAAIDAALPIAQQDANTYGTAARDNQAAVNADRLADQAANAQLVGQEVGIRANLDDAERNRGWQSGENQQQRDWQSQQQEQQNSWQAGQNTFQRQHESQMAQMDQQFKAAQAALDRDFNGTQNEKQFANQRYMAFYDMVKGQQGMMSEQLAAIYANTNLKPAEQTAAANNVRAAMTSLFNSFAATMAQGIPEVIFDPYVMRPGSNTGGGTTVTPPVTNPDTGGGGGPAVTPDYGNNSPWRDPTGGIGR